ncbi:MAG: CHAT domain-containing protein [Pseudomonadota bacterium]
MHRFLKGAALALAGILAPFQSFAQTFEDHIARFGEYRADERYTRAVEEIEAAIALFEAREYVDPLTRAQLAYGLADTHRLNGHFGFARAVASDALNWTDPPLQAGHVEFYAILGWAEARLGNAQLSANAYSQAADIGQLINQQGGAYDDLTLATYALRASEGRALSAPGFMSERMISDYLAARKHYEARGGATDERFTEALIRAGFGYLTEARALYETVARDDSALTQVDALARMAVLDWQLGNTGAMRLNAEQALRLGGLADTQRALMQLIIDVAEATPLDASALASALNPSGGVIDPENLDFSVIETIIDTLAIAVDRFADVDASGAEEKDLLRMVDLWVGLLPETTAQFTPARLRWGDMATSYAALREARGEIDKARDIYMSLYNRTFNQPGPQAIFIQAGLGRVGVVDETGAVRSSLRTRAALSEQAAAMAEDYLTSLPSGPGTVRRDQVARYAGIMEQALDTAFELLETDFILGPDGAPNVTMGRQTGPYVFPWAQTEGYVRLAGDALPSDMLETAFRQMQLARQSQAANALAAVTARQAAGDDALGALLRERDALIAERTRLLSLTGGRAGVQAALAEVDSRQAEIDAELAARFPDYAAHLSVAPVSVADVRDLLAANEMLLSYLVTPGGTHVVGISKDAVIWHRAEVGEQELEGMVNRLRAALDPRGPLRAPVRAAVALDDASSTRFDLDAAHRLYADLVAPLAAAAPGVETLLIAADGALQSLPFGAMVASSAGDATDQAPLHEVDWAIRHHAFVTLPLPGSLGAFRAGERSEGVGFVGIGDPAFSYAPEWLSLAPLPETRDELVELNGLVGGGEGTLLLGGAATEARLSDGTLSTASVIAFATHGLMGGEAEGLREPALALTPAVAGTLEVTGPDDGLLTTSEIAQMELRADWVLLSACNTASGEEGAEGLSGLARAFFYAGARGVIVSHWAVESQATVALTTGLFAQMQDATGPEALQASMLAMLDAAASGNAPKEWAHPAIWAPFVVVGGT